MKTAAPEPRAQLALQGLTVLLETTGARDRRAIGGRDAMGLFQLTAQYQRSLTRAVSAVGTRASVRGQLSRERHMQLVIHTIKHLTERPSTTS